MCMCIYIYIDMNIYIEQWKVMWLFPRMTLAVSYFVSQLESTPPALRYLAKPKSVNLM